MFIDKTSSFFALEVLVFILFSENTVRVMVGGGWFIE